VRAAEKGGKELAETFSENTLGGFQIKIQVKTHLVFRCYTLLQVKSK
jgi:hypothetical protein